MRTWWIVIGGWCLVAMAASAVQQATNEQIEQAIKQLGDDSYAVRQKATLFLWNAGARAEPFLRKALESSDAEVVARARDLLDKIPFGITPNSSPKFVALIARSRNATPAAWTSIVSEMLNEGTEGYELARSIADRQSEPSRRALFRRAIDKQGWRVANRYIIAGQFDRAEEVLGLSAAGGSPAQSDPAQLLRHYAAIVRINGTLAAKRTQWEKWAAGREGTEGYLDDGTPDGKAAKSVAAYLAKAAGDYTRARALIEPLGKTPIIETMLFDAGAWRALIDVVPADRSSMSILVAGLKMIYARLSGNADATAQMRKDFEQSVQDTKVNQLEAWRAFRAILFDGRPDDALAWGKDVAHPQVQVARAEIMAQRGQVAAALNILTAGQPEREDRLQLDMAAVRLYAHIGDKARLDDVLKRLKRERYDDASEHLIAADFVEQLVAMGKTEAALDHAAALLNGNYSIADVYGKVYPRAPLAAEAWHAYLRATNENDPLSKTVRDIAPLIDQRLNEPANKTKLEAAVAWAKERGQQDREKYLRGFAEAYQVSGQTDQALALLNELATSLPAAAHLKRGDIFASTGQWRLAAEAYETSWKADEKQALPLWLAGFAWEQAGNKELGQKHRHMARLMPMGDESQRTSLCDEINKRVDSLGDAARAEVRFHRQLIVDLSQPGSNSARDALSQLCQSGAGFPDRRTAAEANQRFLIRMLRTNAYFKNNNGYLTVLHRLLAERARDALSRGDMVAMMQAAKEAHALLPTTYVLAVDLVPELAKRGQTSEADAIYQPIAATLDQLIKDYPQSADFAGNRAWLAARCRRDLDLAVDLAKKAVELAPESTGHRETLSEVYLQKGDKEGAKAALQPALEKLPRSMYLQKLMRRIETGDASAPLPER